ncbi:MAG: ZIP family metal transporter [Chloroflexota bacterium]|nr:ZIP family metal transporter [Chloroflexota bacterium]
MPGLSGASRRGRAIDAPVLALALALTAGLADVLAGLLAAVVRLGRAQLHVLAALGAGFILAAAVLDLIPEVIEENRGAAPLIALGYLTLFVSENVFSRRAHAAEGHVHVHGHALVEEPREEALGLTTAASVAAFVGLSVHAFFDGVAVVSGFAQATGTGLLIFLAVLLHKLPEGFSLAAIMLAAGRTRRTAVLTTVVLGLATLCGGLAVVGFGELNRAVGIGFLAFAAGTFLYVGATDLIPAINAGASRLALPLVFLGFVVFYVLLLVLQASGLAHQ